VHGAEQLTSSPSWTPRPCTWRPARRARRSTPGCASRWGSSCLRQLTRALRIPVPDDPRPDDPIQLTWAEFLQGWERITATGFRVERTAQEAWPHFRGWRVNYEAAVYKLAAGLDAIPAPWSGPRRHDWGPFEPRRLINRTPDHPEGEPLTPQA
jgi:hypothetical protein